jgi:beta-lactamase regulating signal transducer with metallopeptidase domain
MSMPFIDADLPAVVSLIVKASVLLVFAAAAHVLLSGRTSAAARHGVWTLTVVGLLMLPLVSATIPAWEVAIPVSGIRASGPTPPRADVRDTQVSVAAPASGHPDTTASRTLATLAKADAPEFTASPFRWAGALMLLYAAGALLLLGYLATGCWIVRRLARSAREVTDPEWRQLLFESARCLGVSRPIRLLRSRQHVMPMTFGTRRPTILIPAIAETWTEERRRAVLLHEIAHVVRYDCLTQLLAAVACALYWFHPGVWWVARRLRVERELACDDRVLVAGTQAREYAGHLLELAYSLGGHRAPALVVSMARPRQLEGRMLAVLDGARNRATPGPRGRMAGIAIAAALLVSLAGIEAAVVPGPSPVEGPGVAAPHADLESIGPVQGPAPAAAAPVQEGIPGTWEIRPDKATGFVHLRMTEGNSSSGTTVPVDRLEGLSSAQLSGAGSVRFGIRRDAGTFTFEGVMRNGVGAGTFTFAANPAFPAELVKRGLAKPTPKEQYELARHDVGLALVDELTKQGYQRPAVSELVRAGQHGVSLDYLRGMGELGYRLGVLDALIKQRDHGVTPRYIRELGELGLTRLSADELLKARDHGVSPEYVRDMRALGYASLNLEQLVTARDHGVSPEFVREMGELGHQKLPLDVLIGARDHGVSPGYVRELRELGYTLGLPELTKARDHGVSPEFVRELKALGYANLTLDALIRLRDHGVTPKYVSELKALGYDGVAIDDLVGLRDRGVTPERIRRANARAGTRLPLDMLKSLTDGGDK